MNRRGTLLALCAPPLAASAGIPDLKAMGGALKDPDEHAHQQPRRHARAGAVSNFVAKASPEAGTLLASVLK